MSKDNDKIKAEGVVIRTLPGLVFDLQLSDDFGSGIIKGHLSGNMRKNSIKLIEGDTVTVELTPYDLTKGRITYRGPLEKDT